MAIFAKKIKMVKLFVAGLPADMDDQELNEIFSDYGRVVSAVIILDRETKTSRCFGFVEMADNAEAADAMKKLNGGTLEDKTLTVKLAEDKKGPRKRRLIFGCPLTLAFFEHVLYLMPASIRCLSSICSTSLKR